MKGAGYENHPFLSLELAFDWFKKLLVYQNKHSLSKKKVLAGNLANYQRHTRDVFHGPRKTKCDSEPLTVAHLLEERWIQIKSLIQSF